jgi:hypothetical protein
MENLKGKRIFVKLIDGKFYNGKVLEVVRIDENRFLINILDKKNDFVGFSSSEIKFIKEEDENNI